MSFSRRISSPYVSGETAWLRGNLHTHTTESDGSLSPQAAVAAYAALGYDFLMISDHDRLTPVDTLDPCGMTLIQGNEITGGGPHVLHVGAREVVQPLPDRQAVIDAILADGGLAVMNHPNWETHFNHCPQSLLERLTGYMGIEVFNGVTLHAEGSPYAMNRWDMLLSQGRRVWGFAHDDCHAEMHHGMGWNMVQGGDRSPEALLYALKNGRFYASTGAVISRIDTDGGVLRIQSPNAQAWHVCADHGRVIARAAGNTLTYSVPELFDTTYLRVECFGPGAAMAWTQPFFLH